MRYSNNVPAVPRNGHHSDEQKLTVDIGHASEEEFRWWTSLLPPGQGWRSASGKQPVWAIALTRAISSATVDIAGFEPFAKQTGSEFLSRLASYNLDGQIPLALAAT